MRAPNPNYYQWLHSTKDCADKPRLDSNQFLYATGDDLWTSEVLAAIVRDYADFDPRYAPYRGIQAGSIREIRSRKDTWVFDIWHPQRGLVRDMVICYETAMLSPSELRSRILAAQVAKALEREAI